MIALDEMVASPIKRCSCGNGVWYAIPKNATWLLVGSSMDGCTFECPACLSTMFIPAKEIPAAARPTSVLDFIDPAALRLASPQDRGMYALIGQTLQGLGATIELRYPAPEEDEHATNVGCA